VPASTPHEATRDPFAAMLHRAFLPTVVLSVVGVVIVWAAVGERVAGAAMLGVLVTISFFSLGLLVMVRLRSAQDPARFLASALAVVMGQLIFLLLVIIALSGAAWLDGRSFGLAALAVALVWQLLQVMAFVRGRRLAYDEISGEDGTYDATEDDAS
jgi:ATP synthase protein I